MLIFEYSQLKNELDYHNALKNERHINLHLGQLKLFFTELFFLAKKAKHINKVLYIGAATGYHISKLADLFPKLQFDLWDPGRFDVSPRPNIKIYNQFFTDTDAHKYKKEGTNILFMCDIRTIKIAEFKKNKDIEKMDELVEDDMMMQAKWAKIINPKWTYLKMRLPYEDEKMKYLTGKIYLQPYSPQSTEMRLLTNNYETYIEYNSKEVDEKMAYFNFKIRPFFHSNKWKTIMDMYSLKNNWDNYIALTITYYFLKRQHHIQSKYDTGKYFMNIINFHIMKFGDKYNNVLFDMSSMIFFKKYDLENIRVELWKNFLDEVSSSISQIVNISTEKIKQQIINYFTLLLGSENTNCLFFVDEKQIFHNEKYFYESFKFLQPECSNETLINILKIIANHNTNYCHLINERERGLHSIKSKITKYSPNDTVQIKINTQIFNLSKKHYHKLKDRFIAAPIFLDIMICTLLTRYKFYQHLEGSINLSADNVYKFINKFKYDSISLEAFAGSLNSNLSSYCSLFYDVEKYFDSLGNFFNLDTLIFNQKKIIICNPPFITSIMQKLSEKIIDILKNFPMMTIINIIPDWRSIFEFQEDADVININTNNQINRSDIKYSEYQILKKSEFFKKAFSIGNYNFYDFFSDKYRKIGDTNTLIVILSNRLDNVLVDQFELYLLEKK
uniref:Cap-specific mRNA (nucleoside-2'-O-)-methyltransferase n=1 Tax=viral metagenome TaxID=1070528 RepID=A0A6C0LSF8_9ZZZZ